MNNYMKTVVAGIKNWVSTQFNKNKANWTVNDPTDPRYVHGRTHWVEETLTALMPEQTMAFAEQYGVMITGSPVTLDLVEGQFYTVNFDGVRYEVSAKSLQGTLVIGNASIVGVGDDSGEPFLYVSRTSMWATTSTGTEHTIGVFTTSEVYHPLDEKFVPMIPEDKLPMIPEDKLPPLPQMIGRPGTGSGAEVFNATNNEASGSWSHAEGYQTIASGYVSHAEGFESKASGAHSHAEGTLTIASGAQQHVQGKYNIDDTEGKYAHIVGNGESEDARSNAHTVDWNGLGWFAGGLKVGGIGQDDSASVEVATKNDIANIDIPQQVQADYSVNDSLSKAYIANRPFYDGRIKNYINIGSVVGNAITLDETTGYYYVNFNSSLNIQANTEYWYRFEDRNEEGYTTCREVFRKVSGLYIYYKVIGNLKLAHDMYNFDGVADGSEICDTGEIWCYVTGGNTTSSRFISTQKRISIQRLATLEGDIITLDTQYLPTTVPRTSTATVGQTIVVKTIDENGVPTEWEAVDMPEQVQSYTATIGTVWEEDSETGVKFQTVALEGLTAEMTAKVDTVNTHDRTSDGYALFVEEQNQFLEFITNGDAETVDGGVKFYIYGEANTVAIPIVVEVG